MLNLAPAVFPEVDDAIVVTTPKCSQVIVDEQDAFCGKDRWWEHRDTVPVVSPKGRTLWCYFFAVTFLQARFEVVQMLGLF